MMNFNAFLRKMRPTFCFFFLLMLCYVNSSKGQPIPIENLENEIKRAGDLRIEDATEAFRILETALELSKKENNVKGEWKVLHAIGRFYRLDNQFNKSIEFFQKAVNLSEAIDSSSYKGKSLFELSNTYLRTGRLNKTLELANLALGIFRKNNDANWIGQTTNVLGNANTQLGKNEVAIKNYLRALEIFDSLGNVDNSSMITMNLGYYYLMNGHGEMALPYVEKALEYSLKKQNAREIAMNYGNLAYTYSLMGKYGAAFENYQIGIDTAQHYGMTQIEYDTYKDMSETYLKSGNSAKALEFYEKYHLLKDSIIGQKTQSQISELEVQFETSQKEQEIVKLKQGQRIQRLQMGLLIGGLVGMVIIGLLFFNKMRGDIKKKQALIAKNKEIYRLEKELASHQFLQQELEQQKIKAELKFKNRRLTDFALDIAQKNQFSSDLLERLGGLEKQNLSKQTESELRKIRFFVTSQLQINEGVAEFQKSVDDASLEFNQKLQQQFPNLTQNDIQLCSLLKLKLQNKEIATIRNVSDTAIKMARYRLRKKLGLDSKEDIVDFLNNI